jgi:hypothetical protein
MTDEMHAYEIASDEFRQHDTLLQSGRKLHPNVASYSPDRVVRRSDGRFSVMVTYAGEDSFGKAGTQTAGPYLIKCGDGSCFLDKPKSREPDVQPSGDEVSIKLDWYCSPGSEDDAAQLNLAIARKDLLAAAGHVTRNGAFNLPAGTRVTVISHGESSLAFVRVVSGFNDGQTCWLPSNLAR